MKITYWIENPKGLPVKIYRAVLVIRGKTIVGASMKSYEHALESIFEKELPNAEYKELLIKKELEK